MASLQNSESREDIPLKSGTRSSGWCNCNEDCLGGSRFINFSFGTITVIITIALLVQIYYGDYQVIPHGSVATDSFECSNVGTTILKQNGNAADAAIASAFCLAVTNPHVVGLDGDGQFLIYNHRSRLTPNVIKFSGENNMAIGLPRLAFGLAYIHQQYASLSWKKLVEPSINIARGGFLISNVLVQAIKVSHVEDIYGRLEPGQILKLEVLADTLEKISKIPEDELYQYITIHNTPTLSQAIKGKFNNYDVYVPNEASIGPLLLSDLEEIESFNISSSDVFNSAFVTKLATNIIYNQINISQHYHQGVSSNVAVMDLNDNYVSLVLGMNQLFGSGEITTEGYILDVKNKDKPCSRLPIVLTDANVICGRRMVFGANDLPAATQMITSLLIAKENATQSIEAPRFYVFSNYSIGTEESHIPVFPENVIASLKALSTNTISVTPPYTSINIVEKLKDDLNSHSDSRGGGISSRF